MLTNLMPLKALIFDLDSTLVDASLAYKVAQESVGFKDEDAFFQACRQSVKHRLPQGHTSAHHRLLYFKQWLEQKGLYSHSAALEMTAQYEVTLQKSYRDQWEALNRPQLFNELKEKYVLAVITNETARTQLLKLSSLDPKSHFFKIVVTSEDVGVEKPHETVFREVYARLNLQPQDCVVVGDDIDNDIVPALKMGSRAVWTTEFIQKNNRPKVPVGSHAIDRLANLPLVLQEISRA